MYFSYVTYPIQLTSSCYNENCSFFMYNIIMFVSTFELSDLSCELK